MAIILPLIRLCLLSSNILISYKTLKRLRNHNGERTSRYIQARKRDLKNCLLVWTFWVVCLITEPFFDRSIGILPLYYEVKTILWLTLLLTRSIVAEPIFIHFIRPAVKPYVTTIDLLLDLLYAMGELLIELAAMPFQYLHSLWRSWRPHPEPTFNDQIKPEPEDQDVLRPNTRSQVRETTLTAIPGDRPALQHTRSKTSIKKKSTLVSGRGERSIPANYIVSDVNIQTSRHTSTTGLQFLNPRTLNFDDDPRVTCLKAKKARHEVRDNQTTAQTEVKGEPDVPGQEWLLVTNMISSTATRSISDSILPTGDAAVVETEQISPWSGTYPPLPAAYPASPTPLVPLSLPSLRFLDPPFPPEPYPPFPSAYPFTPPSRTLTLQPPTAAAIDIADSVTSYQPFSIPMKEEDEDEDPPEQDPVSPAPGPNKQKSSRELKVDALRQALIVTDQPPSRHSKVVSTSAMVTRKRNKASESKRAASATTITAMKLASEEQDPSSSPSNQIQVQPEIHGRHKTTSQVPRKRSFTRRTTRRTTRQEVKNSKYPEKLSISVDNAEDTGTFADAEEGISKRRRVSRETSTDSRRTSRETSQERYPPARTRRTARVSRNTQIGTSRDSRRGRPLERIPGPPGAEQTLKFRRTRSTTSNASASAAEAYRLSRHF